MKTKFAPVAPAALVGAFLAIAGIGSAFAQDPKSELELGTTLVSRTATVDSVDPDTRQVTLKTESGVPMTLSVDSRVKRLNEIKPGDTVTVDYYVSVATDFRPPTEAEKNNPVYLFKDSLKAPKDAPPGAGEVRMYEVVATVEGIDRSVPSMTIKGPRGNYVTVKVKDAAKLQDLNLGDSIVVTYVEALAVEVNKVDAKPGRK